MKRLANSGILLVAILAVSLEVAYTRAQLASGGSGEERLDAWMLPGGTILFFAAVGVAVNRGGWVRLVALAVAGCGLSVALLGYVLVTRW